MNSTGKALGWSLGIILSLVFVAAIVYGGWQLGWWFQTQNTNRQAHLYRSSYGNQQTLRDTITAGIAQVTTDTSQIDQTTGQTQTDLKAERYAHVNSICAESAQVTGDPLDPQQQSFVAANCLAGTVNPASQYAPN